MAAELLRVSLGNFIQIYLLLLIVRILLSWFQTADWAMQVMGFLSPVTDPYLNLFRSFIPPLGGLDLSPIIAIFLLQAVGSVLGGGALF
ncbi:YGGT family protein [[Synechococcus] sp. NIES-970]|uniref:YggT family protein n=1 Tax=Picosynechococcus sp. NKBG15041c TaxID=1407650 RepID=UPI0003FAE06E|nr:YggT family protein [Picosynechococcus sp. NKBG15041c]BAW97223.1 YGGT family protein [[Synechococcus] sp. NIES-970]